MKLAAIIIFIISSFGSINAQCTLSRYAVDGHETSVIVRVHDCTSSTGSGGCGAVEKEIEINKGQTADVIHKSGQYVKALFTGKSVCFAWNKRSRSSSYWTDPTVSNRCQETCTETSTTLSYDSEMYCGDGIGCTSLYKSLKVTVTMKSATGGGNNGFPNSCPMTLKGKSGNVERARIEVWNCFRPNYGSNYCGDEPQKSNILLKKGDGPVDLGYDVNDYRVLARFYGDETCVSFRYYNKQDDRYECEEKCWTIHEDEGSETEMYRSERVCHWTCHGGYRSLRFYVKSKGARPIIAAPSLVIALLCCSLVKLFMM